MISPLELVHQQFAGRGRDGPGRRRPDVQAYAEPPDRVLSRFLACFRTRSGREIWAGWELVGAVAASLGGLGTALSSKSKSPAEILASPKHRSPRSSLRQISTIKVHFGGCQLTGTSYGACHSPDAMGGGREHK